MGSLRVGVAGMAALALVLSGVPASTADEDPLASACADAPQGRFLDVSGVHQAGIDCIGWWGVTQGGGDGSYGPGDPVNRAQMATFVARAIELSGGQLPEDAPSAFSDTATSVHARAIDQLAALEVVGGVGGGRYAPDRAVTRDQMATFLSAAWQARTGQPLASGEVLFDDVDDNVHAEAITAITAAGWTGGTAPGIYAPRVSVSRAQMGTFLARWLTTLIDDGHATYPPANPVPLPEPEPDPEDEEPGSEPEDEDAVDSDLAVPVLDAVSRISATGLSPGDQLLVNFTARDEDSGVDRVLFNFTSPLGSNEVVVVREPELATGQLNWEVTTGWPPGEWQLSHIEIFDKAQPRQNASVYWRNGSVTKHPPDATGPTSHTLDLSTIDFNVR